MQSQSDTVSKEKKNEKLNLRISEYEKDLMTSAARASGHESVSSWARKVLISNANIFEVSGEKEDLLISITGHSIQFSSEHVSETISIPNAIAYSSCGNKLVGVGEDALKNRHGYARPISEGMIGNVDQFKMLLQIGFHKFSEKYSFSGSNVLVTARVNPPGVKHGLKKAINSVIPCKECFLMEYTMACAIGIGLPVTKAEAAPQPLVCIEDDWLEIATIYYGGTHSSQTMSVGFDQMIEEKNEETNISMKRIATVLVDHLGSLSDFGTAAPVARPILLGRNGSALGEFQAYLKAEYNLSCEIKVTSDAAILGSRLTLPELEKLIPVIQANKETSSH
ncbi:rod shape-determining protein [Bdellovibrionales bacterium]|nr:rod shape-determining protein [Bdellovibrionales bacterium]